MGKSLLRKVLLGVVWKGSSQVSAVFIRLTIGVFLARLLTPRDFGLIGMVTFFSAYIQKFSQLGLGAALVQKDKVDDEQLDSVYWMNIFIGLILASIMIAISPLIAGFYGEPQLLAISITMSILFIISSIGTTHNTIFSRELNFAGPTMAGFVSQIAGGVVAITLAFRGYGVWSLVWLSIVTAMVRTGLLWFYSNWRPRFRFRFSQIKSLIQFGLGLQGTRLMEYLSTNADKLLIGKFIGAAPLGYYDKAFQLSRIPMHLAVPLRQVMFPAYSRIQNDIAMVHTGFIQASRYLAVVTFPLMLGAAVLAEELIIVIYGEQWYPSIPLMQIICVAGAVQSIEYSTRSIFLSHNKTMTLLRMGIAKSILMIMALGIGVQWGVKGVAIAYTLTTVFFSPVSFYYAAKVIQLSLRKFFRPFIPIVVCTAIMGIIVSTFRSQLYHYTDVKVIILFSSAVIGVISFAISLWFINRDVILELKAYIRRAR